MINRQHFDAKAESIWKVKPHKQDLKQTIHRELLLSRDQAKKHARYLEIDQIEDCIKNGDIFAVDTVLTESFAILRSQFEQVNQQNHNTFQKYKYAVVVGVAFAVRAGIKGGIFEDEAFAIRELFTDKIDHAANSEEVEILFDLLISELTQRVYKVKIKEESIASQPVLKAINYMAKHVNQDLSLSEIAGEVGLSVSYLSNVFKSETGLTISQYKQKLKINEACRLLSYTELTLVDISESLGFCSQSYFSNIFKEHMGVTPKHFKKNCHIS